MIGRVDYSLCEQEILMLKLLLGEDHEVYENWKNFWQEIGNYENATFSCKELMPAAVRRFQLRVPAHEWRAVAGENLNFLAGLPRYAFARNQQLLNDTRIISERLQGQGIEVIGIKGVGEILSGGALSAMRISRDIDLLVMPASLEKTIDIAEDLGWKKCPPSTNRNFENYIKQHAVNLTGKSGLQLDVHIAVIPYLEKYNEVFTRHIWDCKQPGDINGLFVPSTTDRLLIATANAYNIGNWRSGMYCKYLYDAIHILRQMPEEEVKASLQLAGPLLGIGPKLIQVLSIAEKMSGYKSPAVNGKAGQKEKVFVSIALDSSAIDYLVKWKLISKSMEKKNKLGNKMKVAAILLARSVKVVFTKGFKTILKKRSKETGISSDADQRQIRWYLSN